MFFSIEKAIFAIGKFTSAVVDDLIISIQVGASCANLFVSLGLAVCLPEFDGFVAVAFLLRNNVYKCLSVDGVLQHAGILGSKYDVLACAVLKC